MTKNKKLIAILAVTTIVTTFGGCTENKEERQIDNIQVKEKQKNDIQKDNIQVKEKQKNDIRKDTVQVKKKPQDDIQKESEEGVNYKALYKKEVNNLIGTPIKRFRYGELIDFDKDNIPEMVMLYHRGVVLYTIKGGKVEAVYEKEIGCRYGQGDVSYRLGINTKNEKISIINYNSENSWEEELIEIITLEKGNVVIKKLYAKAKKDNYIPVRENLVEFFIDDKPTTLDKYNSIYNSTVKEAKQIDTLTNGESESKELLNRFLSSLE